MYFFSGRICDGSEINEEFSDNTLQGACNGMVPYGNYGTANYECESVSITMENSSETYQDYDDTIVVCRYNNSIIGCICAANSEGNPWSLDWDSQIRACY